MLSFEVFYYVVCSRLYTVYFWYAVCCTKYTVVCISFAAYRMLFSVWCLPQVVYRMSYWRGCVHAHRSVAKTETPRVYTRFGICHDVVWFLQCSLLPYVAHRHFVFHLVCRMFVTVVDKLWTVHRVPYAVYRLFCTECCGSYAVPYAVPYYVCCTVCCTANRLL